MYKQYNPLNWFWSVGNDTDHVYSSAKPGYVSANDAEYIAWVNEGGIATQIHTLEDLRAVLIEQNPKGWRKMISDVLAEIDRERNRRWRAGFPVIINGQTRWFHSDEFSLVQHLGLKDQARDILAAGGTVNDSLMINGQPVAWATMDGGWVIITVQIAFDLVTAAGLQQAAIFAAAETHRATAQASAAPESYDYLQGWPLIFADTVP